MTAAALHVQGTAVAPRRAAGEAVALLALLLAILVLDGWMLRPGQGWSDDFAMYVAHALNLLNGHPYGDTGYIANPWAVPGPLTYPPVYPLVIAPALALRGVDLHLLKGLGLVMLGGALASGYALLRSRVGVPVAMAGVALLGLCPYVMSFNDEVRPDSLFLFFFLLTLWLGERWCGMHRPWSRTQLGRGLVLGGVAYLAYGTRSVGMVLLPALIVTELWRLRRLGPVLAIALPAWLVLGLLQSLTLHSDSGYARLVTLDPHTLVYNATHYLLSLSVLWSNGLPRLWDVALRGPMFAVVSMLAVIGYVANVRRGLTVLEVIPVMYMAPLIVYWVGTMIQQRYMLPLFPIYLYQAWTGLGVVRHRFGAGPARVLLAVLGSGAAMAYASAYVTAPRGEIDPGLTSVDGQSVLAYVREHTPADAVLLVGRARAFPLYTHRRAASPYGYRSDADLWGLIRQHGITHVVVGLGPLAKDMDYEHPDDLAQFATRNRDAMRSIFHNASFDVLAIRSIPVQGPGR